MENMTFSDRTLKIKSKIQSKKYVFRVSKDAHCEQYKFYRQL